MVQGKQLILTAPIRLVQMRQLAEDLKPLIDLFARARDWRGLAQKLSRPLTISDCARTCFVINKDGAGQTTDSHRADKVSPDASTRGRPQTAHRSLRA